VLNRTEVLVRTKQTCWGRSNSVCFTEWWHWL